MEPTRRAPSYELRFLGRHLEQVVEEALQEQEFGSAAEIARSLRVDPSTLHRWIKGDAHPRTEEDWERLTRLGLDEGLLRRLQLLDKLDAWRRDHGLAIGDLVSLAIQIQSDQSGEQIFRTRSRD